MSYELTLKVRNGMLLDAMRACGYNTAAELSRASGIGQSEIGKALNLQIPLFASGYGRVANEPDNAYRKIWVVLSDLLGEPPERLVPPEMHNHAALQTQWSARVSADQLQALIGQDRTAQDPAALLEILEDDGLEDGETPFDRMIRAAPLNDRHRQVLEMRMRDGLTLEECAKHLGVSRARVRQMEQKALRLLRKERVDVVAASGRFGTMMGF